MTARRALVIALRLGLGGLFLWAAATKIADPREFARDIANYRMLPDALAPALATLLPFIEAGLGLAAIVGLWTRAAAVGLAGLMGVFTIAVGVAFARGLDVDCGCFGGGGLIGWGTIARDVALLGAAVALVLLAEPATPRAPIGAPLPGETA